MEAMKSAGRHRSPSGVRPSRGLQPLLQAATGEGVRRDELVGSFEQDLDFDETCHNQRAREQRFLLANQRQLEITGSCRSRPTAAAVSADLAGLSAPL